ncbi:MAG: bifunctional diaminohydroxyphosphoribosylaminopyrimidine deaminase/5-amino-6-(5-phosphoribosylamino)uracil reductase RibD [Chitinophagaceae bacterium]
MLRCLELAKLGSGHTAPNPMVGAVLVFEDRIIGEGWHRQYGEAHAEVRCIGQATFSGLTNIIHRSTLYVSLEPCAHFGKTPPCTDLIIQYKIPKVVIGCLDPFKEVNGRGIEKLRAAGVDVQLADGLLADECKKLNKRFFTFQKQQRPYIILKWAQTGDGKLAHLKPPLRGDIGGQDRLLITNGYSNRLVHQWRTEEAAILVGTNTALLDDPELTSRLWPGKSPIRLVIDMDLRLPATLRVFNGEQATIIFNTQKHTVPENMTASLLNEKKRVWYYQLKKTGYQLKGILDALYGLSIQSVLVEGGAKLLKSFIDEGLWDEIRVITNEDMLIGEGLAAPKPENAVLTLSDKIFSDTIDTYFRLEEDY